MFFVLRWFRVAALTSLFFYPLKSNDVYVIIYFFQTIMFQCAVIGG